jgi:hypothetical protein
MANNENEIKRDPATGNVFGWKTSIFAAIVIISLLILMLVRHNQIGVPFLQSGHADSTSIIK